MPKRGRARTRTKKKKKKKEEKKEPAKNAAENPPGACPSMPGRSGPAAWAKRTAKMSSDMGKLRRKRQKSRSVSHTDIEI